MIYLDNAATSFPKPRAVTEEQARCMRTYCGNPGRGAHRLSLAAAEKLYACREAAGALFGCSQPEHVVFTWNTTMSINTVLKGVLRQGDHVLLSDMEHNAVYRPICKLAQKGEISYDIFPTFACDPQANTERILENLGRLLKPRTQLLIAAHASNICSLTLPLYELGEFCRKHGILFAVDAAQSAGHIPIDMERMQIDALCVPGHKGLLGPQGSGLLLLGEAIDIDTLLEGGSGFQSLSWEMPNELPERLEAGTLPTPAIAGLYEGICEVQRRGVETIGAHMRAFYDYLAARLAEMSDITVYAPHHRGAVLLLNKQGLSADQTASELDRRGICVRAGYHCTALGHRTLQTPHGGAVRISPGIYSTRAHADALCEALCEIRARER